MTCILHIETSTKNCSVSLSKKGKLVSFKEINTGGFSHAEMLHPLIQDILKETETSIKDLQAVSVSKGPGSYTGLRIGVSAAKGICFAQDIPLISIDSLTVLAHAVSVDEGLIVPMIDARRMEVYTAVFDKYYNAIEAISAKIIDSASFNQFISTQKVVILGDGAEKCKSVLQADNITFKSDKFPSAKEMISISYQKYLDKQFEDVAYFEPFYLKDFVVTPQKKNLQS